MTKRHIVVTGAASGIGAALCTQLISQGSRVTKLDIASATGDIIACDLSDPISLAVALAKIDGPIDGLALVAGLPGTRPSEKVLRVNFLSARQIVAALGPKMSSGSCVVVVASIAAHRCTWDTTKLDELLVSDDAAAIALIGATGCDGNAMYELSKRLLLHWVPHMAAKLSALGIRVNAVSPGPVETPILTDFYQTIGEARMEASRKLVGRHGNPDEVANVVNFLLSPASAWVNGIEIKADGGMQAIRSAALQI